MVAYFKRQNNLFMFGGGALGLLTALILYPYVIERAEWYVRAYTIGMFVIVGVVLGRIVSSRWCARKLKSLQAILYQENRPEEFIKQFAPRMKGVPENIIEYIDGNHHIAYAYEAMGEYDKALELLESLEPEKLKLHNLVGTVLVANQIMRLYLLKEDCNQAQSRLDTLKQYQTIAQSRAPSLAANLSECIRLGSIWLLAITEPDACTEADIGYLREEWELANNPIHKLEMQQLVARFLGEA